MPRLLTLLAAVVALAGVAATIARPAQLTANRSLGSPIAHPPGSRPSAEPPASLKCVPPKRPRQEWYCSPAPCTARLVWKCEDWCKPGHYPTLGDIRANGGKFRCVKHGLAG